MGRVFYVRHGQASLFSDNYDQLSETGYRQAAALGAFFRDEDIHFDRVFLGPLDRHRQTLERILKSNGNEISRTEELDGLKEHQGYKILKSLLPRLLEEDAEIRELVNQGWNSRKEQIRHHMRIYEHFSLRWANGAFDHLLNGTHQSWEEFIAAATRANQYIRREMDAGQNILVVTSGGPKAVACGLALDLSPTRIMHTSWNIYNCSVTEFLHSEERFTLSSFNNVSYLKDKSWRTLV